MLGANIQPPAGRDGDEITLRLSVDEPLLGSPEVSLNLPGGARVLVGEALDDTATEFRFTHTIDEVRDAEGAHLLSANLLDLAGNAALGETHKAIEYHDQALVIFQEIGDRRAEAATLDNLGLAYAALGETRKAIDFYEQQLVIVREIGDRIGEGNASYNLVNELVKIGRDADALAHAKKAVEIYEQIESPHAAKARAKLEELRGSQGQP